MHRLSVLFRFVLLAIALASFLWDSKVPAFGVCASTGTSKSKTSLSNVAIPRNKHTTSRNRLFRLQFSSGILGKLAREVKSSFSSDLEALTLQLTKPDHYPISPRTLTALISFVNEECANKDALLTLCGKLSRKLSEYNVYTKLKVFLSLHSIMEQGSEEAQVAISEAVSAMCNEEDIKNDGCLYFDVATCFSPNHVITGTVGELETIKIAKKYANYVLKYMDLYPQLLKSDDSWVVQASEGLLTDIADILSHADEINKKNHEIAANRNHRNELMAYLIALVKSDESLLLDTLAKIYEAKSVMSVEMARIETILKSHNIAFTKAKYSVKSTTKHHPHSYEIGDDEKKKIIHDKFEHNEVTMKHKSSNNSTKKDHPLNGPIGHHSDTGAG